MISLAWTKTAQSQLVTCFAGVMASLEIWHLVFGTRFYTSMFDFVSLLCDNGEGGNNLFNCKSCPLS